MMDPSRNETALAYARSGLSDREISTLMTLTATELIELQPELQRERVRRVAALRQRITKSALEGDPAMLRHLAVNEVPPQTPEEAHDYGMPGPDDQWISCHLNDPPAPEKFGESGFPPGHPIQIAFEQAAERLRTEARFWIANYRHFRTAHPDRHPDEFIRELAEQLRLKLRDNGQHLLGFIEPDSNALPASPPYAGMPATPEQWVAAAEEFRSEGDQSEADQSEPDRVATYVPPPIRGPMSIPEEADPQQIAQLPDLNPPYRSG